MKDITSEEIDILRGIAALGVIVGHALYEIWLVPNGSFWVWIFFVISGFLQGHFFFSNRYSLDLKGIGNYYFNRIIRIVPLLWLTLLLGWGVKYSVNHSINLIQFLREFFCLTSDYQSVGPVWSISCEMAFYLLVPLFILMFKKKECSWMFLILISAVIIIGNKFDNPYQPRMVFGNIPLFLAGIWTAYIYSAEYKINSFFKILFIVGLVELIAFYAERPFFIQKGMFIAAVVAISTVLFQGQRTFLHNIFIPLRFVGKYCYGVYMYAALISVISYSFWKIRPGYLSLCLQLLGIPLAYFSYHFFEKHFLKLKINNKRL